MVRALLLQLAHQALGFTPQRGVIDGAVEHEPSR